MFTTKTATLAVLLAAAALLAPAGQASAVGEACRGEAATIVGDGSAIRGTEGRDVVITNNSQTIHTLGGDDLVCVTGRTMGARVTRGLTVSTGDGNDVVDASAAPRGWPIVLSLGVGADEFQGSPVSDDDIVSTGPVGETDRDVVRGGGGRDRILSRGGDDEVYGEGGRDAIRAPDAMSPSAVIDGGPGRDSVILDIDNATWRVDLASGATRADLRTHTWSSIEKLTAIKVVGRLVVTGTPGPDEVAVFPRRGRIPMIDVRTGRGADRFSVTVGLEDTSTIDLGRGSDQIKVERDGDLTLSLRSGLLVMGGVADVRGVEHATAFSRRTVLIGTDGRNRLRAGQCDTRIHGRGGADEISWGTSTTILIGCEVARATVIHGGAGGDTINGSRGPDLIDGGPGFDTVDGWGGRDRCLATERRTNCELTD